MALHGRARLGDGREVEIRVTDLSQQGCRVESDATMLIGDIITLNAAPLRDVAGLIRWELCGTAGVCFVEGDCT